LSRKVAIITGSTGQDGAYLCRLLAQKGYKVVALIRSFYGSNLFRLKYLDVLDKIELQECDLSDLSQVIKIISLHRPTEVYNLAAQSSVSLSFQQPIGTIQFNINSVLNMLEAIRLIDPSIRFYQASTSEMYGKIQSLPIDEESVFHPLSPYAISKVAAHHISINYRESYGMFTSCGILFNHESYLRGNNFFMKKLLQGALEIKNGRKDHLEFGNLSIRRDFGYSERYVEAMWLMLQHSAPDDYMVCSGRSVLLRDLVEHVFDKLNISKDKIVIDPSLFRPTEIEDIYGTNEKARRLLNWHYDLDFFNVLDNLLEEESRNYGRQQQ
jgi:GDPmannose 4,6-dehydratase